MNKNKILFVLLVSCLVVVCITMLLCALQMPKNQVRTGFDSGTGVDWFDYLSARVIDPVPIISCYGEGKYIAKGEKIDVASGNLVIGDISLLLDTGTVKLYDFDPMMLTCNLTLFGQYCGKIEAAGPAYILFGKVDDEDIEQIKYFLERIYNYKKITINNDY
jgi:hypothetical protein